MPTIEEVRAQAATQKREASALLCRMFQIPEGLGSGTVERVVDCIVSAAILETAAIQAEALKQ